MPFSEELKWFRWPCLSHLKLLVSCPMTREAFQYRIRHRNRFSQTENDKILSENNGNELCPAFIGLNSLIRSDQDTVRKIGMKSSCSYVGWKFLHKAFKLCKEAEQKFYVQRGGKDLFILAWGHAWAYCLHSQLWAPTKMCKQKGMDDNHHLKKSFEKHCSRSKLRNSEVPLSGLHRDLDFLCNTHTLGDPSVQSPCVVLEWLLGRPLPR